MKEYYLTNGYSDYKRKVMTDDNSTKEKPKVEPQELFDTRYQSKL
ncbi:hypothetical protein JCM19294_2066 [Nonlabens tegetincola]|uniref:Uncharacterized protein n=1 Tax=Nonlabens tegetincola TaxID=323273 RepID=A0A090Q491_9FLAO|nr:MULTISPECIES: hypothetical protein [Nonlabens]GAK96553.1 hypothetical protein JCM19294_2066 [Nonlabens tegetincola]